MAQWGVAAALLGGCPDQETNDSGVAPAVEPPVESSAGADDEFRRRAHAAALKRLTERGQAALQLADPITAHALGLAPLAPLPLSRTARAPLRKAVTAALTEETGIDRAALTAQDGMLRDAVSTALHATRRELQQRPALRRDPTVFAHHVGALLQVVRDHQADGMPCPSCADGLRAQAKDLAAAVGQLGATSAASLAAAQTDLKTVRAQVQALTEPSEADPEPEPGLVAAARALLTALDAVASRLQAIADNLDAATAAQWSTPLSGATDPHDVRRLPDRLGHAELSRRLADDEALRLTPEQVASELTLLLARLEKMRARLEPEAAGPASPATTARCDTAWATLTAWAEGNDALTSAAIDCTRPLPNVTGPVTDAELMLAVFDHGVVGPTRRTRRSTANAALALASGAMAPAGHALALPVSGLMSARQSGAAELAIARARRQLCVALAATLEHGQWSTPPERAQRLARDCQDLAPETLVKAALARPRAALAPAGMLLIAKGPAEALALSRFWWAPLGLVLPLADPARTQPPNPASLPQPKVELLQAPKGETG